ncbi:MAG: DUF3881 family protein [Hungatella sp.]|nr:DUF3881 family protein [Hungatella sp.]
MHRFLRTVGFSKYQKKHRIDELMKNLVDHADAKQIRKIQLDEETNLCEVRAELAPSMGVAIYGEMDETGDIKPEYYVPYMLSQDPSSDAECSIQRHTDRETYAGLLDEYKVGISLIYYLENAMEYRERKMAKESTEVEYVNLVGMSITGKILLPIEKSAKQKEIAKVASKERSSLLEAAKNGNEEAMETLTIEDIDLYSQISRRVLKEDIYSIIDSCFMPCGIECDQYSIIGNIQHMEVLRNRITEEEVYAMRLECNDMIFHVAINKKDLIGEPKEGRRFKGQIWMIGTAKFKA